MIQRSDLHISHHAMGSPWEVDVYDCELSHHEPIKNLVMVFLNSFEDTYSRFKKTSLLSQLRDQIGIVQFPPLGMRMIRASFELYEATGGLFNPCIAKTLEDMGYDANYSLHQERELMPVCPLHEALRIVSEDSIELLKPVALDFGALGKGCAVDMLAEMLQERGEMHFIVNGSGDMIHRGPTPIRVGLEHPHDATRVIGIHELCNSAIASSGRIRRSWKGTHHIINPQTHESPDYILATWVTSASAMYADALATALFLTTPDELSAVAPFEYVLINKDMRVISSPSWEGEIFS